ncbi:MAG: histidine phosphatase family protein [Eisenbergiella sp.]
MVLYVVSRSNLWNAQIKYGVTDIGLNETGIEQAEELANSEQLQIDIIVSSPLKRAVETSKIVAKHNNISFYIEEFLIEQNYGIYEGVDRRNPQFLNNKRNFAYKYPNGESMMQVAYRVYGGIDKIRQEHQKKDILLITHGGVCRIIRTYFKDMTNDEFFNYTLENGRLEKYEL